ncbi:MAG: mercury resistance system periplasmic binding protein MerP [Gammaproteobacteria bacterium]|nr:MAG: mercury resistance system periplasmic binding protein MerP [Gammaproteobacteria bacterium]
MKKIFCLYLLILLSFNAQAKQQTITLDLPTMNCVTCPFTVKMSLNRVDGVSKAEVSYKTKHAVVTFDDVKASTDDLVKATTNAGYPSTVINK